jgi:hypothetical protein
MSLPYARKNIRVKGKNILTERFFRHRVSPPQPEPEAPMLKLLPTQPLEPPAQHEALVSLAGYRTRLEKCPDDRNGNWHEAATTAWSAMLQFERMVAQLLDISAAAPSQAASEAIDYAIDQLVEAAGTLTVEAERRAEDDAVNGGFYCEIDNWNIRRGGAE